MEGKHTSNLLIFIMAAMMIALISVKLIIATVNVHGVHYPAEMEDLFNVVFPWVVIMLLFGLIVTINLRKSHSGD